MSSSSKRWMLVGLGVLAGTGAVCRAAYSTNATSDATAGAAFRHPVHAGSRVLAAGNLVVEVMDPSDPQRYNCGVRFTPVAAVLGARLGGREFLYNPVAHNPVNDHGGLAAEFGTTDKFIKKLDSLFTISSQVKGESAPPDVSGLVGQYAHGNEPSHHIAYMYDFVGEPWKTQEKVRFIVDSMYHAAPDGYAGNEDCGQMSAWAIWSMVGMYPANPANGQYVFGSPMFDEVRIKVPANKEFVIKAKNNSKSNCYIQSVTLNGKPYSKVYIDHAVLMKGGVLEFVMGAMPNKKWGVNKVDWPASVN